jgi:FkbH-like protein
VGPSFGKVRGYFINRRAARGIRNYERGNHVIAFRHLMRAARAGHPDACFRLGQLYARNHGVLYSPADAVYWYCEAAEQGHAEAQFELSLAYLYGQNGSYNNWYRAASALDVFGAQKNREALFPHGIDVPQDYAKALHWGLMAAEQGRVEAQANVGLQYLQGLGCNTNYDEAFRWLSRGATGGNPEAQYGMGVLFDGGLGVPKDLDEGLRWYEEAAAQGSHAAQLALGLMCASGERVERDPKRAALLFQQSSDRGNVRALNELGLLYVRGEGIERDLANAESCFRRAARRNYVPAMMSLAWLLTRGLDGAPNLEDAALWYRAAADLGDVDAQFQLGVLYGTGGGLPLNLATAAKWYRLAAEQGHRYAQNNLAELLLNGSERDEDPVEAAVWYAKAAEQDVPEAILALGDLLAVGRLLTAGRGIARDLKLARRMYERAASQGNEDAAARLAEFDRQGDMTPHVPASELGSRAQRSPADHDQDAQGAMSGEPVRLVIWDLDETFWGGTLSEGGIRSYIEANHDAVVALARRGIMSSICSKNDFAAVREILQERGIWDYFIFPSIDWTAKADRVASIIAAVELRARSVLFIDDQAANRAEVAALVPGIQLADATILPALLDDPRLTGRDDHDLTRLAQYRVLETRNAERLATGGDDDAFLRASDIRVIIETDVAAHLDRAIELINRTNQLNFTKRRLPEDMDEARAQLMSEIEPPHIRADLIRVVDVYGDYGYCGFYRIDGSMLLDFCFSCRILGMGLESWIYERLGRPEIEIAGEVVTDLTQLRKVDWITPRIATEAEDAQPVRFIPEVRLRGGCVLEPLAHYFRLVAGTLRTETNRARAPLFVHADSSAQLLPALGKMPPSFHRAVKRLGYAMEDFASRFLSPAPPGSILIYSAWADVSTPIYRHKAEGFAVPVDVGIYSDLTEITDAELAEAVAQMEADEAAKLKEIVATLRANFALEPVLPVESAMAIMKTMFERIPKGARLFVILPHELAKWDETVSPREEAIEYNIAVRALARNYPSVTTIEMSGVVAGPQEIQTECDLFDRAVYFRLFQQIMSKAGASAPTTTKQARLSKIEA